MIIAINFIQLLTKKDLCQRMTVEEAVRHRWLTRNSAVNARRMLRQRGEQLGYISTGSPKGLYPDDGRSVPFPSSLSSYVRDELSSEDVEDAEDSDDDDDDDVIAGKRVRDEDYTENRAPPRLYDHSRSNGLGSNPDSPRSQTNSHRDPRPHLIPKQKTTSESPHHLHLRSPHQRVLNVGGSQNSENLAPRRTYEEFVKSLALTTSTPCSRKDKGSNE